MPSNVRKRQQASRQANAEKIKTGTLGNLFCLTVGTPYSYKFQSRPIAVYYDRSLFLYQSIL